MVGANRSDPFSRRLLVCRLAVYLWYAGMAWAWGLVTAVSGVPLGASLSAFAALLSGCATLLATHRFRPTLGAWRLHLLESLTLTLFVSVWLPAMSARIGLLAILLAANTALWGIRCLPLLALTVGLGFVLAPPPMAVPPLPQWLLLWYIAGSAGFVLVVCAMAHVRVSMLLRGQRRSWQQAHALSPFLPRDLREELPTLAADCPPVHATPQWMSVVFIDLIGFTHTARTRSPQQWMTLVNDFMARVNAHVEAWEGYTSKFLGDGMLCIFPADQVQERTNAVAQAVRCVGLLPAQLARPESTEAGLQHAQIRISCGIASGECWRGAWGSSARMDYTVIGPPVNLAQRLQAAAPAHGGILMDAVTRQLALTPLAPRTQPLHLLLPGAGPVQAFALPALSAGVVGGQ